MKRPGPGEGLAHVSRPLEGRETLIHFSHLCTCNVESASNRCSGTVFAFFKVTQVAITESELEPVSSSGYLSVVIFTIISQWFKLGSQLSVF